jgi:hypothetical protein
MRTYSNKQWKQKVHAGTRAGRREARAAAKKARKARAHIGVCMSYRRESVDRIAASIAANDARIAARAAETAREAQAISEPNNVALKVIRNAHYEAKRAATAWRTLADSQIAANKLVNKIAAVKLAADLATRQTLVALERLNERAHELSVRRLEKLKRSYITL